MFCQWRSLVLWSCVAGWRQQAAWQTSARMSSTSEWRRQHALRCCCCCSTTSANPKSIDKKRTSTVCDDPLLISEWQITFGTEHNTLDISEFLDFGVQRCKVSTIKALSEHAWIFELSSVLEAKKRRGPWSLEFAECEWVWGGGQSVATSTASRDWALRVRKIVLFVPTRTAHWWRSQTIYFLGTSAR